MQKFEMLGKYVLCGAVSLIPLIFGSYLIYDRVALALLTGQTEERIGIVERSSEPISFWVSVGMYGLFGCLVASLGVWGFWRMFKLGQTTKGKNRPVIEEAQS